jgi:short-subunit dehydrogenase involved in D-alanine esterification of teichoic acids
MNISGNTVFIPGSTSGIGLALVLELQSSQENSEFAMPLEEFVTEAVALLQAQPDAKEIQVEQVKFLRYGEARGDYDQVVETLNASGPNGK